MCLASFLRQLFHALDLKYFLLCNLLKAFWFCVLHLNLCSTFVDLCVSCEVWAFPLLRGDGQGFQHQLTFVVYQPGLLGWKYF